MTEGPRRLPMAETLKGRGAAANPPNRFVLEKGQWREPDPEWKDEDDPAPGTRFTDDVTRSIVAWNDSPDLGFAAGINPYRGCEHGCIYCYARPTHEYLGLSAGLDFETRIVVKPDAPRLLRAELSSKRWVPQPVALSGVTDCYQPVERRLKITRGCLEVLLDFRNPVFIITKNALVLRDVDLLAQLAAFDCVSVTLSITSLDPELSGALEPRAARPRRRLEAVRVLSQAGVPVHVNVAPVIPGLNDKEIPAILEAAKEAGAGSAWMGFVRLPHGVKELFDDWLARHRPGERTKVLERIRGLRGGRLNDARWHTRFTGEGAYAEQVQRLFDVHCRRLGLDGDDDDEGLSTAHFRVPPGPEPPAVDYEAARQPALALLISATPAAPPAPRRPRTPPRR
jgi:DNA repair photolyase